MPARIEKFTEKCILEDVVKGYSYPQIARRHGVSRRTVIRVVQRNGGKDAIKEKYGPEIMKKILMSMMARGVVRVEVK